MSSIGVGSVTYVVFAIKNKMEYPKKQMIALPTLHTPASYRHEKTQSHISR